MEAVQLKLRQNLDSFDDFYEMLDDTYDSLNEGQSKMLSDQLILLLSNHIGDLAVAKGDYTLYVDVSDPDNWTLIVNKQTGQWGTKYDKAQDLGRVPMTNTKPASMVENLTYTLVDNGGGKGSLTLAWEDKSGSVMISAE